MQISLAINMIFQSVAIVQIEYSTAGENPDDHAQGEKLYWLSISVLLFRNNNNNNNNK
jgi:hypothetical protein